MNQGRIIVITGSPGTGKTTTASIVAKESDMDKSVHMHTDDFITIQKQLSELFLYGKQTRVIWKDEKTCNKKISI
ncbi:TPA: zeta toxin family protein [Clostridioides difficile]